MYTCIYIYIYMCIYICASCAVPSLREWGGGWRLGLVRRVLVVEGVHWPRLYLLTIYERLIVVYVLTSGMCIIDV